MPILKNPLAENDAQRIARIWLKKGQNKARLVIKQIVERKGLVTWERCALVNRAREIVEEKTRS